ncbi:CvpA family protein [Tepidiforma flava]|uniref:CvpA family protein n=1 Tax=Tepidiforma flava TaxID=3004094 RepID=A0ABY7M2P2_9CHLR|nr:CvpA family protein [Tepidiforma flava]WBL34936.1 CvpA family protein [Tepidiforma flava]
MNWLDLLLIAAIGLSAWRGYANGFIRELVILVSVILAIPIAGALYARMFPKVDPIIDNEDLSAVISFLAIMAGVIIGGNVAAHLLKRTAEMLNLGGLDRLAGGLFGILKAALVAQAILIVIVRYPSPDLRDDIQGSRTARILLDAAPLTLAFLPQTFETGVELFRKAADAIDEAAGPAPTPAP